MAATGCKKVEYAAPIDALYAMLTVNKTLDAEGRGRLRGMYKCQSGQHYHLTRQPGDRPLMARTVTQFLEERVARWREQMSA